MSRKGKCHRKGCVREGEVYVNYVKISEASEDGSVKEGEAALKEASVQLTAEVNHWKSKFFPIFVTILNLYQN